MSNEIYLKALAAGKRIHSFVLLELLVRSQNERKKHKKFARVSFGHRAHCSFLSIDCCCNSVQFSSVARTGASRLDRIGSGERVDVLHMLTTTNPIGTDRIGLAVASELDTTE